MLKQGTRALGPAVRLEPERGVTLDPARAARNSVPRPRRIDREL